MTELDVLGWLNGGDLAEAGLVRCCVEAKRGGQVVTYAYDEDRLIDACARERRSL
jgi:hypothetical protein